jgi:S-adenosylmethionine:tRNA ribosyltransferase-isomerase
VDPALFDYSLPDGRVAQEPAPRRQDARLLVLPRRSGPITHRRIADLPDLVAPGDLLVLNDTRVVPARLWGVKGSGGRVELLVLPPDARSRMMTVQEADSEVRPCLLRASRRPRPGETIALAEASATVLEDGAGGEARVRFRGRPLAALLAQHGEVPLPPYIRREPDDPRAAADRERYQTVFARVPGAVAAPTAGLHLTSGILSRLEENGIETAKLTLHVGPGTFRPVTARRAEEHVLPPEQYCLDAATVAAVQRARRRGGKVIACGTTVVRVLEARAGKDGEVRHGSGWCDLLILPGHRFRVVDGVLTNFHLPRTSLLMLVCAFAGRRRVLATYQAAISAGYRFYSYGDAMLVTPRRGTTA